MIVSHRHKFIFMKTMKTGSTSVEVALAAVCGPDDIITTINRHERHRSIGPQHDMLPPTMVPIWDRVRGGIGLLERHRVGKVPGHMRAAHLRRLLGRDIFDRYLKISIERNPWDREVSHYLMVQDRERAHPEDFEHFVRRGWRRRTIPNFDIYAIGGSIVADVVMQHASLAADFEALIARLDLPETVSLPRLNVRQTGSSFAYRDHYNHALRDIIARRYRREIAAFGYSF